MLFDAMIPSPRQQGQLQTQFEHITGCRQQSPLPAGSVHRIGCTGKLLCEFSSQVRCRSGQSMIRSMQVNTSHALLSANAAGQHQLSP